jgi:hypothetical protein
MEGGMQSIWTVRIFPVAPMRYCHSFVLLEIKKIFQLKEQKKEPYINTNIHVAKYPVLLVLLVLLVYRVHRVRRAHKAPKGCRGYQESMERLAE